MEKQHINITSSDLIHKLLKIKNNHHSVNWKMSKIYHLQDTIISESYNFNAFSSILMHNHVVDIEKPPFKNPYGIWYIHCYSNQRHLINKSDLKNLINSIIKKIKFYKQEA